MSTLNPRLPMNPRAQANLEQFLSDLHTSGTGNEADSFETGRAMKRQHDSGRARSREIDRRTRGYSLNRNGPLHRNYDLRDRIVERMKLDYSTYGGVPNPQRLGCYYFIIESLKALGTNEQHSLHTLRAKVEELMGPERWSTFCKKRRRRLSNMHVCDTPPDVDAKLHCNCRVLQRTKDYGKKLLQVGHKVLASRGCVIDIIWNRDEERYYYRLNTDSETPLYHPPPGRKRGRRIARNH